jgi:hypothetical protein
MRTVTIACDFISDPIVLHGSETDVILAASLITECRHTEEDSVKVIEELSTNGNCRVQDLTITLTDFDA